MKPRGDCGCRSRTCAVFYNSSTNHNCELVHSSQFHTRPAESPRASCTLSHTYLYKHWRVNAAEDTWKAISLLLATHSFCARARFTFWLFVCVCVCMCVELVGVRWCLPYNAIKALCWWWKGRWALQWTNRWGIVSGLGRWLQSSGHCWEARLRSCSGQVTNEVLINLQLTSTWKRTDWVIGKQYFDKLRI